MTYAELAEYIGNLTLEQQQMDVTIYVVGVKEYYPLVSNNPVSEADVACDVLDVGHPYLTI